MIKPRYAEIDLSTGKIRRYPISEKAFELYLGGKALAARILYDELQPGTDPLCPDNILIVNTGPMNGTGAPSTSRFNVSTKNVLTGGIASSNCGGTFGVKMRRAGYDGIILKGKAPGPSYIEIIDGEITIQDASHLWGLNTEETQHKFDRRYGALVIGPAGENLVKYACTVSGERVAGRCGVGAVMGSKNIKALLAYGTQEIPVYDRAGLKKYIQNWVGFLRSHQLTGHDLGTYGTAGFLSKCNASGILPTRNFQKGSWDKANMISGEELAEKHLTRNSGCISCPIRCERRVMVEGKEVKGPEYETVGLFGSNIENSDLGLISQWNYHMDLLGMDTISMGGTLAFAMELQEKGIKDFGIKFGESDGILETIYKVARREGDFSELADGSKILSEKYGGQDFAIHAKGMELAAYEPRKAVGMGLGYATSNRGGCHLNGGYLALLESIGAVPLDPITTKSKPELTVVMQDVMEAVSTAGFCLFTAMTAIPNVAYKLKSSELKSSGKIVGMMGRSMVNARYMLRVLWKLMPAALPFNTKYLMPHVEAINLATGFKMSSGNFLQIGERGYTLERMFNMREGLSSQDDDLPGRLTKVPSDSRDPNTVVKVKEMLPLYYRTRGWDEKGIPTQRKIKQLGL